MLSYGSDSFETPPIFDQLSEKVRTCVLARARVRHYTRGETICLQGEPAGSVKVVQSGWVKLYRVSQNGQEAVLATLSTNQSFDELAALQDGNSPASAEAVSDCAVLSVKLSNIQGCEDAYREINSAVLSAASLNFDAMMGQIEQLKISNGAQRLSHFLVDLSDGLGGANEMALPYEKVVLAAKLGMKPESLSRAFRRLNAVGVKSKLRHVSIEDLPVLRAFALEDQACA